MRKYISTLLAIFLLSVSVTAFAGSNKITSFKGILKSVSLVASDNTEYPVLSADTPFTNVTELTLNVEAGPSGQVPYGDYKAIKYVFTNEFEVTGYVELTSSGAANGRYYTTGNVGIPTFEKDGTPATFKYSYGTGSDDWGWCTTVATVSELTTTQNTTFTLGEASGKSINLVLTLEYLWFGNSWTNFNETTDVVNGPFQGGTETFFLQGTTLTAPWIDPPEFHIN